MLSRSTLAPEARPEGSQTCNLWNLAAPFRALAERQNVSRVSNAVSFADDSRGFTSGYFLRAALRLNVISQLRLKRRLVARNEFQKLRYLNNIFAHKPDAVRIGALDYRQIAQHLRRAIALEPHVKLYRRFDEIRLELLDPADGAFHF